MKEKNFDRHKIETPERERERDHARHGSRHQKIITVLLKTYTYKRKKKKKKIISTQRK